MLDLDTAAARLDATRTIEIARKTVDGETVALLHDRELDTYELRFDGAASTPCDDLQDAVARFNALDDPVAGTLARAYRRLGDMRRRPEHTMRVVAVGATPEDAIRAFSAMLNHDTPEDIQPMHDDAPAEGTWSRVFRLASSGAGMKAAGCYVPGGVVMTWWK